jgi:potassium voltage-gated channel Shal-related subfamily D protein 2
MRISIKLSQDALLALAFFILMVSLALPCLCPFKTLTLSTVLLLQVVIIFSTLLYFAERGSWDSTLNAFVDADGDPTNFASIPAAAWFVLVTLSTVGYVSFFLSTQPF